MKLEGIKEEYSQAACSLSTSSSSSSTTINKLLLANSLDGSKSTNSNSKISENENLDDGGLPWSINELENTELICQMHDWNFPIFKFYEKSNHYVLSKVKILK